MLQNGDDLAAFYKQPLGQWARHVLARRIRAAWPSVKGLRLLAYGYGTPYMRGLDAERAIAAMPAQLGVPAKSGSRHARLVCAEDALPFPDVFFDRILIVHGLEGAEVLRPMLRQLWRVLAPEGRVLLIAPQPRQPLGAARPLALRPRTALQPCGTGPAAQGCPVRARALGAGALCAAVWPVARAWLGKHWRAPVSRHRRRACGGSDQVAIRRRHARPGATRQGGVENRW